MWRRDCTTYQEDDNPIWGSFFATSGAGTSVQDVRMVVETAIGGSTAAISSGIIDDLVKQELGRQVRGQEIKNFDKDSIASADFGNGFDTSYKFAPAEAVYFIVLRAHCVRMPS